MQYFRNIDFLRFLLCLSVILRHIHNAVSDTDIFANIKIYSIIGNNYLGYIPVDCFFIISGFFLFFKTNFTQNIYKFMKKKLIRLLPVVLFATIIFLTIYCLLKHKIYIPIKEVWTIFMMQNVGFTSEYSTLANTWYVSVLFWVSCLYFYLYKIMDKKWFNILMCITAFLSYTYYFNVAAGINVVHTDYIFNYGIIRGIAGISLGYIILQFYRDIIEKLREEKFSLFHKLSLTALESILLIFISINIFYKPVCSNCLLIILAFCILFTLFSLRQGFISKLLDNNFSKILGQYTYSIYVTHVLIRNFWIGYFYKFHQDLVLNYPILNILTIFILALLFGIFTYYFFEKPVTKYLINKYCK